MILEHISVNRRTRWSGDADKEGYTMSVRFIGEYSDQTMILPDALGFAVMEVVADYMAGATQIMADNITSSMRDALIPAIEGNSDAAD